EDLQGRKRERERFFLGRPKSDCAEKTKERSGLGLALRIRFRQWRHWRNLNDVQPALSLARARPASRPGIFARTNSPRAMRATDARIILIMERVVRDVMLVEIAPNLF